MRKSYSIPVVILAGTMTFAAIDNVIAQSASATSSPYAVNRWTLGTRVQFGSTSYREFTCDRSEQFNELTWCKKTRNETEFRGSFRASYSMLHSSDGKVLYVNRFQEPAYWGPDEVTDDIERYSRKIGERPQIIAMPRRTGFPNGTLAIWGKVVLEPLTGDDIKSLAEGKSPKRGILIDFIGNFVRSARNSLPVYRITGGAGFVWAASYQDGRGTLRFAAIDPSALSGHITQSSPYTVGGLTLGDRVRSINSDYRCDPSEQFGGFTFCRKTWRDRGPRGFVDYSSSILHSSNGTSVYINRSATPEYFDSGEFGRNIQNLSRRFGEKAQIWRLPQGRDLPEAVIATWGKIKLEPLDPNSLSILASGGNVRRGFLIDFLGDYERSARQGLQIYRLTGGAGYVWAASRSHDGRGHVRYLTMDASAFSGASPEDRTTVSISVSRDRVDWGDQMEITVSAVNGAQSTLSGEINVSFDESVLVLDVKGGSLLKPGTSLYNLKTSALQPITRSMIQLRERDWKPGGERRIALVVVPMARDRLRVLARAAFFEPGSQKPAYISPEKLESRSLDETEFPTTVSYVWISRQASLLEDVRRMAQRLRKLDDPQQRRFAFALAATLEDSKVLKSLLPDPASPDLKPLIQSLLVAAPHVAERLNREPLKALDHLLCLIDNLGCERALVYFGVTPAADGEADRLDAKNRLLNEKGGNELVALLEAEGFSYRFEKAEGAITVKANGRAVTVMIGQSIVRALLDQIIAILGPAAEKVHAEANGLSFVRLRALLAGNGTQL